MVSLLAFFPTAVVIRFRRRTRAPRVVIADDDSFSRLVLERLLVNAGITVSASVSNDEAVTAVERVVADIVLVALDRRSGCDVVRRIASRTPASRILVLASSWQDDAVREALESGACGRVLRDGPVDDIVDGVRAPHCPPHVQ
jgi:DNA-binding NarL/FixJ family response regulator